MIRQDVQLVINRVTIEKDKNPVSQIQEILFYSPFVYICDKVGFDSVKLLFQVEIKE